MIVITVKSKPHSLNLNKAKFILYYIIFYILFKNVQLIAVASSITFLLWYLKTDYFFCKRFNINWRSVLKRYIFISITIGLYYILQKHMDFILYLLISSAFGLLMYKDEIYKIKNLFCGL